MFVPPATPVLVQWEAASTNLPGGEDARLSGTSASGRAHARLLPDVLASILQYVLFSSTPCQSGVLTQLEEKQTVDE